MRQALRCRRAKRPAGTGCLPVQADGTAQLDGRGTGSRLPGNPGMAGHRHASDRSRRHQKNRQPLIGLNRIILLASRRASVADIEQSPAADGYRRIVLAGWLALLLVSYFGVLWCFLYRHTPAQDQRQGLAFRVHRQIYDLNWNPPRKPETLHGITSPDRPAGQPRRPAGRQPRRQHRGRGPADARPTACAQLPATRRPRSGDRREAA